MSKSFLSSLAVVSASLCCQLPVALADQAESEVNPRELTVTASRSSRHSAEMPGMVTVLSSEQIERSGARNVADLLRELGAIRVTDLYGDGRSTDVSARGFGETANATTLVLVDGRRLNNFDTAAPDLNSIPLSSIKRVEVLQDSATVLYGDQAIGGVINIITHAGLADRADISVSRGSYNSKSLSADLAAYGNGDYGLEISVNNKSTDNYRDHNEADYEHLSLRSGKLAGEHQWFFEYDETDDRFNAPGGLFEDEVEADRRQGSPRNSTDFSDNKTQAGRLSAFGPLSQRWGYEVDLSWREGDGNGVLSGVDFTQNRRLQGFSPRFNWVSDAGSTLLVGLDIDQGKYELVSRLGITRSEQDLASLYLRSNVMLNDSAKLTLGGRLAQAKNYVFSDDFFLPVIDRDFKHDEWAAELGLRWQLASPWALSARLERIYRLPKVDEISFSDRPELEATTGISGQLGLFYSSRKAELELSLWQINLDDEIAYDPTVPHPYFSGANTNLPKTERQGATAKARVGLLSWLSVGWSASAVDAEVKEGGVAGKKIPLVPDYTTQLGFDIRPSKAVGINIDWQHVAERVLSGDFNNEYDRLPSYSTVNASVVWRVANYQLNIAANNVASEKYSEFGVVGYNPNIGMFGAFDEAYYPSPERNYQISLSAKF